MYDVFISKNTTDLARIRELISFLDRNGIKYFESERNLVGCGKAEYGNEINNALSASRNMIVICSKNENCTGEGDNSSWVHYEWTAFHNEMLSKRKMNANIIVLRLDDVDISELPLALRVYQSYPLQEFLRPEMLSYLKPEVRTVIPSSVSSYASRSNRRRGSRKIWIALIAVMVIVAAGLYIMNNVKLSGDSESSVSVQQTVPAPVPVQETPAEPVPETQTAPVQAQPSSPVQTPPPAAVQEKPQQTVQKPSAAAPSLRDRADSGDPAACYELAVNYQNGSNGVTKNLSSAFTYMKAAADAGYVKAFRPLGEMYHGGRGVEKDRETAVYWYRLAADNGDARALRLLNNM